MPVALSLKIRSRMKTKTLLIFSFVAPMLIGSVPSAGAVPEVVVARRAATVNCGPNRRTVVRPIRLNGQRGERIVCVGRTRAVVTRAPHRSWKKSALVIGGSSAAGAGVGALIGGGKGALIGGLAGGAAGSAYEIHNPHKLRRPRASR